MRLWVVLVSLVALAGGVLAGTSAWAAAPVFVGLEVKRGPLVGPAGPTAGVRYAEWIHAFLTDADGAGDLAYLTILDTEGKTHTVEPGAQSPNWWIEQEGNSVWVHWTEWGTVVKPPPGRYTLTVYDKEGNLAATTTPAYEDEIPDVYPTLLEPLPNYSLEYSTIPVFKWTESLAGANHWIQVWDETVSGFGDFVWANRELGSATECTYGSGGEVVQDELTRGHTYGWLITPWRLDYSGTTDDGVPIEMYTVPHAEGRFTVYSPSPAVVSMGVHRGRDTSPEGAVMYHEQVWGLVSDADGWADIASVTVTDSQNQEHAASLYQRDSSFYWTAWGEENAPPPGVYTVTVTDTEGHSDMASAEASAIPEETPVILSPPADNSLASSVPTFSWSGSSGWPYSLCLQEVGQCPIWYREGGESLFSVVYNDDGKAAQPELTPGHVYEWFVRASVPDVEQSDPRVWSTFNSSANGRFTVYSPIPSISNVSIHRGRDVSAKGVVSYHEHVGVWVMDGDGAADIASVIITDTEGDAHPLGPGSAPNGEWVEEDALIVRAGWWDWGTASPPPPGPYSITVVDQVGNSDYLTTASAPQVLEVSPVLLNPPPNSSLIYETVPTFSWAESVPGDLHYITVDDETTGERIWDHIGVVGSTSAVYNFDGGATQPELIPGHIYSWFVNSCHYDDDGVSDPRVIIETAPHSWGRFTVVPSTPVVPGSNVTTSVDGCDVTFELVTAGGVVYSQSNTPLPSGDPDGYLVSDYGWDIGTTAVTSGTITFTVHYDDAFIPAGQEESLQLVRWDGSHWVDITVARDPVNNTLTGECSSLGQFAICLPSYPALPELPGKLAYGAVKANWAAPAVMLYSPDPAARVTLLEGTTFADWSPDGSSMLYLSAGPWPNGSICISHLDGLLPQQIPGVSGDRPRWSSDGTRVCYVHQTTPTGVFEVRTVRIDGSGETVVASSPGWNGAADWSPDGAWLTYGLSPDAQGQGLWKVRYDGTDARPILASGMAGHPDWRVNGMKDAAWSADGGRLAVWFNAQKPDGSWAAGVGVISSAGGGVLTPVLLIPPSRCCYRHCCGNPWYPRWSPDGTKVVVASSHHLTDQVSPGQFEPGAEVWMVNADGSGQPVRLTYNDTWDESISWWAPNTPPTQPGGTATITKGDTTITLENVQAPGTTTVTVTNTPPAPEPSGFQFAGQVYSISTTAQISGTITIQIHYQDAEVPAGMEQWLSLLHWENGEWVDITVRPIDTVNNIITGECTSLSPFVLVTPTVKPDWQTPLKNGTSLSSPAGPYKRGSTIPVKFRLLDAAGQPVSDAMAQSMVAQLEVFYEKPSAQGALIDPGDSPPDIDGVFRYQGGMFHYNLSTKNAAWLANYTYGLDLLINGVKAGEVFFSLK